MAGNAVVGRCFDLPPPPRRLALESPHAALAAPKLTQQHADEAAALGTVAAVGEARAASGLLPHHRVEQARVRAKRCAARGQRERPTSRGEERVGGRCDE